MNVVVVVDYYLVVSEIVDVYFINLEHHLLVMLDVWGEIYKVELLVD